MQLNKEIDSGRHLAMQKDFEIRELHTRIDRIVRYFNTQAALSSDSALSPRHMTSRNLAKLKSSLRPVKLISKHE